MALCAFGVFCGLFLPETLHQKLPDSMHEAREFGANQVMLFSLFVQLSNFSFHANLQLIQFVLCCRNSGVFQRRQRPKKKKQLQMKWRNLDQFHKLTIRDRPAPISLRLLKHTLFFIHSRIYHSFVIQFQTYT